MSECVCEGERVGSGVCVVRVGKLLHLVCVSQCCQAQ